MIYRAILFFSFLAAFSITTVAYGATLSVRSAQEHVAKGDTFVVEWFLNTAGATVNVVEASITYSPKTIEVLSLSTANSGITLWTKNPEVVSPGTISFVGGIPSGVQGAQVPVLRATVRAIAAGDAAFALQSSSQVLLSDGVGTKQALESLPVMFSVLDAGINGYSISSPTHPDQKVWYQDSRVVVTFSTKPGEDYSYSMSTNPEVVPDQVPDAAGAAVIYDNLPDGVYYFKLASRSGTSSWQEARVFRVQIDTTAPTFLSYAVSQSTDVYGNAPFASFAAVDKVAGVADFRIKSGWFDWYRSATTPEKLRRPLVGETFLKVRDGAGNTTVVKLDFNSVLPTWLGYFGILVVLIMLYLVIRFLKRHLVFTAPHETH